MKNPPLVIICGSNQQGGAEAQLCKLIESFQDFKIYLLIFSKNNNYGFFKKLIPIKEISLFNFNLYFPINTFRVLYKILKVISKSNQKTILMGWLAKGNLLALLIGLFKYKKTLLFCSHRSKFELNQSLRSKSLLLLSLLIYKIYPKKITHIINAKAIAEKRIIKFFLRSKPVLIKNCYKIKKEIPLNKIKVKSSKYLKLLIVARFSKEKGYELLFDALNKLDLPYKLKCIGIGCSKDNKEFKTLCKRYGIKASFNQTSRNLEVDYMNHDFLLLPSFSEASPNVIVESILAGTPAIITPTGPFIKVLNKYNLVSKNFKSEAFAIAIKNGYELKKDLEKYNSVREELFIEIKKFILTPTKAVNAYKKEFLNNL